MVEARNVPLSEPTKPTEDIHRTKTPYAVTQFHLGGIRKSIARIAEDDELESSLVATFENESYIIHPCEDQVPTSDFPFLVEYSYKAEEVLREDGGKPDLKIVKVIHSVKYECNEILEA